MYRFQTLHLSIGLVVTLAATSASAREIPGFPVRLGEGETTSSPAVADLDRNGVLDVVAGVGDMLYAIDARGRPLEGFPVKLADIPEESTKRFFSSPALCDLDGNGRLSIVSGGPDKKLYVHDARGKPRPGFPIAVGMQLAAAPLCADVDANGATDIVLSVPTKHVIAFDSAGKTLPGFPLRGVVPSESAIATADLTPGGPLEMIVGGEDGKLYLFDGRGVVDRRRAKTSFRITGGASLGDVDGDGKFDVVFGSQDFRMYAVDYETFELKPGFPVESGYRIYGAPALGDINDDGLVDIVFASADGKVYAVDSKGQALNGWPVRHEGKVVGSPSIGDLDLDGFPEVVVVSDDGNVYVFDVRGRRVRGTPFSATGKNKTSPTIVQLDGKRGPEVVVLDARGRLHAFSVRTRGKLAAARIPWPTYAHDAERVSRTRPNPSTFGDLKILPKEPVTTSDLRVSYAFSDLDGTDEGKTKVVWFKNGKRIRELDDKRVVPAAMTRKGERWLARVQGEDDFELFGEKKGAKFFKTANIRILNTAPAAPKLAAEGAAAGPVRFGDAITVSVANPSVDPDNDKIRYRTIWSVNESPVRLKRTAMTLPKNTARRGQRVSVLVVPIDNEEEGEPARMQWTMANTPPSPPVASLSPKVPTPASGATLKIARKGSDVDRDALNVHVEWSLDGKRLPLLPTALSVPGALLKRGSTLAAKVYSHDGFANSVPVDVSAVVGNSPPGRPAIALGPSQPTASSPISIRIEKRATDADGDVPSYTVEWSEGGKPVAALANQWVVPTKNLKKGQRWLAKVVASDGASKGPPATASIVIGNRPPLPPVVAISPATPTNVSEVQVKVVSPATDPDGDKTSDTFAWFADDKPIARSFMRGNTLRPGAFKKGQKLRVEVVTSDGAAKSVPGGDTVVVGDLPPAPPKVALAPRTPRTQTPIKMEVQTKGADPDADAVTYRTHWFVNGARVDVPESSTTIPPSNFVEGDTVSTRVWSVADQRLSETFSETKVVVTSTPPPAPKIEIVPSAPLPGEPLRVQVIEQAPDADGHQVAYDVKWKRNRAAQSASIDGVAPKVTKKGEQWSVHVSSVDGADRSKEVVATVTIGNQAPVAPRIELSKTSVTTTEPVALNITRPASDADGDKLDLLVTWKRNGKADASLNGKRSVPPSATKKGETFEVKVIASDGTDQSEPVRRSFAVVDTPPTQPKIAFEPKTPIAGQDVTAKIVSPSSDVDGDSIRYTISWTLDGKRVKAKRTQFTLPGRKLRVGKELRARVVAVASKASSSPAEARADVAPARPDAPSVVILPAKPVGGETLFAKVRPPKTRGAPADVRISWLRNGKPANINASNVPGSRVRRGEKWESVVVANVAGKNSAPVKSAVTVGNRPPTAPVIDLSARSIRTDQPVKVRVVKPPTDPDQDAVKMTFAWFKNGKAQRGLNNKDTVPPQMTSKGDKWVVRFSSSDGSLNAPVVTDAFGVQNTPPPASSVSLSPAAPKSGQAVKATITPTAPDADGDRVRHRVRFLVDGVPVTAHDGKSTTLSAGAFKHGQRVTVEVVPFDGEDEGPLSRASVRSENSPPSLVGVAVSPKKPTGADVLRCQPTKTPSDPDGDNVDVIVTWEIDGKRTAAGGKDAAFAPGNAPPGASVRCYAFATDGGLASAEVASSPIEIQSRAPKNLAVSMEPIRVATGDSVTCGATGTPTDPDGEPISVTVEAIINGKATGNPRVAEGKVRAGQTIECRARPLDGRKKGKVATAKTVVQNARPSAPKAKISNAWPRAGLDALKCDVAARANDPENDKLLYRIEWIHNGKPAPLPPNARVVPAAALKPSDVWTCRVYARDDGGEGPPSASVHAFVRKPPPEGVRESGKGAQASR